MGKLHRVKLFLTVYINSPPHINSPRFMVPTLLSSILTSIFLSTSGCFTMWPQGLRWSSVLLNLGAMTSERPNFLPWGCSWRSRQDRWAKISLGPLQYRPWYVSTETDCPWVVTCRWNSFSAFTTSQNMGLVSCFGKSRGGRRTFSLLIRDPFEY